MKIGFLSLIKRRLGMILCTVFLMVYQLPMGLAHNEGNQEEVLLEQALQEIGRKYKVYFSYDRTLIDNVKVELSIDSYESVDDALTSVMGQTNLFYQIFDQRYVAVYQNTKEGLESLKKMVEHFQKIIDKQEMVNKRRVNLLSPITTFSAKELYDKRLVVNVSGRVTSSAGEPLIGVNVLVKGTDIGTATDFDGKFVLNDVDENAVLVLSYIGYQTQEIPVAGKSEVLITLIEDSKTLDEVVVVGYGTQKKSDLTGSISSITSKEILSSAPVDISQSLQGKVSGVFVSKNDGAPGSGVNFQIRGSNTFLGDAQPLFVIDGIPFSTGDSPSGASGIFGDHQTQNPLSFINPNDILSIEILKDASATAIYGSRGANGVVLITTKKGGENNKTISVTSNFGVSSIANRVDMLDAYTYALYKNEGAVNKELYEGVPLEDLPFPGEDILDDFTGEVIGRNPSPEDFLNGYINGGTNWLDQVLRTAMTQDFSLSASGGNDKGGYSISGNLVDQEGIVVNSNFSKYSLRANIYQDINRFLTVGTNTVFSKSNSNFIRTNSEGGTGSSLTGAIRTSLVYPSTREVVDPSLLTPAELTTLSNTIGWYASSPWYYVRNTVNEMNTTNVFSSSYLELNILPSLTIRQNVGVNLNINQRDLYYDRFTQEGKQPTNGVGAISNNNYNSFTLETIATYSKSINNHRFSLMGGATREETNWKNHSVTVKNFPNDIVLNNDLSQGLERPIVSNGKGSRGLVSFLGRLNYNYNEKYLVTLSYRRDGTTVFTKNNKWAGFFSSAFAWRLIEEEFISDLNLFDNLKLRVGYGETGNQAISAYSSQSNFSTANIVNNGVLENGFAEPAWAGPANANLIWETTGQFDIGLDMSFLKGKLAFVVDYYHKNTFNLLQRVAIPVSTGFKSQLTNFGTINNQGFEFTLNYLPIAATNFTWDIKANLSLNKNKIADLQNDQFATRLFNGVDNVFIQRNGESIGAIYGFIEDGYYDNFAEVIADPVYSNESDAIIQEKIGEIKYKNIDDDPTSIGATDRSIIGNTIPEYLIGVSNTFNYKGFELSIFLQGVLGNEILNANLLDFGTGNIANQPQSVYDSRWTLENRENAQWPKALNTDRRDYLFSDRYLEDGAYLRVKNVNFGYSFPFMTSSNQFVKNLRVYVNASNLFTFTNYSWFDPDVNAFGGDVSRPGVDMNSYPLSRTYTFGINATF